MAAGQRIGTDPGQDFVPVANDWCEEMGAEPRLYQRATKYSRSLVATDGRCGFCQRREVSIRSSKRAVLC